MNVVIFRFLAMCNKWYIFVETGISIYTGSEHRKRCVLVMYGWCVIIPFQNIRNFEKRLRIHGARDILVEVSVKKWSFLKILIFCIGNPIVNLEDFDDYQ